MRALALVCGVALAACASGTDPGAEAAAGYGPNIGRIPPLMYDDGVAVEGCPQSLTMGSTAPCTIHGLGSISVSVLAAEGGEATIDVELVPRDQPFTGTPTASVTLATPATAGFPFAGLAPGPYKFAVRARDARGVAGYGVVAWGRDANGVVWMGLPEGFAFDQAPPAADPPSACLPAGESCQALAGCCSGTCAPVTRYECL